MPLDSYWSSYPVTGRPIILHQTSWMYQTTFSTVPFYFFGFSQIVKACNGNTSLQWRWLNRNWLANTKFWRVMPNTCDPVVRDINHFFLFFLEWISGVSNDITQQRRNGE